MLPAFTVQCECQQCVSHRKTVAGFHAAYTQGKYEWDSVTAQWHAIAADAPAWVYNYGLDSLNAAAPLCSGCCETHGECADSGLTCEHCGQCDALCECQKCMHCDALAGECECCEDCGSLYCSGPCGDCGYCECSCGNESDECNSSGSFGTTRDAPWVTRDGYKRQSSSRWVKWYDVWEVDRSTDLCQSAADFYLLEALAGGVVNNGAPADAYLGMLRSEAQSSLSALVARLDKCFTGYVDAIIGGELRHHRASGSLSGDRKDAWVEWHSIRQHSGVEALRDAERLFLEFHQGSGYGGEAWANITRVLIARVTGQISPATFVDRVWNLQHNGGSLFDKGSWGVVNGPKWGYYELNRWILPAHGVLDTPWTVLLAAASPEVRDLFCEYWRAANKAKAAIGLPRMAAPSLRLPMVRKENYYYPGEYVTSLDEKALYKMVSPELAGQYGW